MCPKIKHKNKYLKNTKVSSTQQGKYHNISHAIKVYQACKLAGECDL